MNKKAVQTLTEEKIFTLFNKYRLYPETVYLKTVDFAGNILFDDTLKVDMFKIDNFIKDMYKISEVYSIDVTIKHMDNVITFKHS